MRFSFKKLIVNTLTILGGLSIMMILGLFGIIAAFIFGAFDRSLPPLHEHDKIVLMLNLQGPVTENASPELAALTGNRQQSLKDVIDALDYASTDPKVRGVVARLDFMELGFAQIQELRAAIKHFTSQGKWSIAHADTYGEGGSGTGSYYLASAFQEIAIQAGGNINITGLNAEVPFAKDAFEKLDVKPNFSRREAYKSVPETFTESNFTKAHKEALESVLTSLMQQFIKDVAESRKIPELALRQAVDNAPLLAEEGLKQRLIDRVIGFETLRPALLRRTGETPVSPNVPEAVPLTVQSYLRLTEQVRKEKLKDAPKIAIIYGSGEIFRDRSDASPFVHNQAMGGNEIAKTFRMVIADKSIKAIVFRVNSPGGSSVASETIWNAVRIAQSHKIPVVVSMSDLAGSGGYLIATHANKIVAQPGTITGSIGVYAGKFVTQGLWARLGVHWGSVRVGRHSGIWSSGHEFSPSEWQRLNSQIDATYHSFLAKVSEGRHLPLEQARAAAQGRIWTGEQAIKLGLVDALGGMEKAVELAKIEAGLDPKAATKLETFPRTKTIAETIAAIIEGNSEENTSALETLLYQTRMGQDLFKAWQHIKSFFTAPTDLRLPFSQVHG